METLEYRTIDKSSWGDGPWQNEPDKKQWKDEETGLPCMIVRNPVGALCGYVGVPESHPEFFQDYDSVIVEVHGGLTFASKCQEEGPIEKRICHVPEEGEPDNIWWFGFDCAHFNDVTPGIDPEFRSFKTLTGLTDAFQGIETDPFGRTYRTIEYVEDQVRHLARQLAAI